MYYNVGYIFYFSDRQYGGRADFGFFFRADLIGYMVYGGYENFMDLFSNKLGNFGRFVKEEGYYYGYLVVMGIIFVFVGILDYVYSEF